MKKLSYLFLFLFLGIGWASPSRGELQTNVDLAVPLVAINELQIICNMNQSTVYLSASVTAIEDSKDYVDLVGQCGSKNKFNLRVHQDVFKEGGIFAKEGDKISLTQVPGQTISSTINDTPDDDVIALKTFATINVELTKRTATDLYAKLNYTPQLTANDDFTVTIDAVTASKAMADANAPSVPSSNTGQTSPVQPEPVVTASKAEGGCSLIAGSESMSSYFSHLLALMAGAGFLGLKTLRRRNPSR